MTKRWHEAGFKTYFEAKHAYASMLQGLIQSGLERGKLFPEACNEFMGWLLVGHPRWPEWADRYSVLGYAYDYFPLRSETSAIQRVGFTFVVDNGNTGKGLVWFSGYEALTGEMRTPYERAHHAFATELALFLSERVATSAYIEQAVDYDHLRRLIFDFCNDNNITQSTFENAGAFSRAYPHHIVDRELAALWRKFLYEHSMWGRGPQA